MSRRSPLLRIKVGGNIVYRKCSYANPSSLAKENIECLHACSVKTTVVYWVSLSGNLADGSFAQQPTLAAQIMVRQLRLPLG